MKNVDKCLLSDSLTVDYLTGCYDRRALEVVGTYLLMHAFQRKAPLSLVYFDIDNLKKVNKLGHIYGDRLIQRFVDMVRPRIDREDDFFFRAGGDEFLILSKDTTLEQSAGIAHRLHAHMQEHFDLGVTYGVTTFDVGAPQLLPFGHLIGRADQLMIQGKETGGNTVIVG